MEEGISGLGVATWTSPASLGRGCRGRVIGKPRHRRAAPQGTRRRVRATRA
jgi:hypothetical protein